MKTKTEPIRPIDIAKLAGVSTAAITNWSKRYPDFPPQIDGTSARPLYDQEAVLNWLEANDKLKAPVTARDRLWLIMTTLRGHLTMEDAVDLVVQLLLARQITLSLSAQGNKQPSIWNPADSPQLDIDQVTRAITDALTSRLPNASDAKHRYDIGEKLSALKLEPETLANLLELIGEIPADELADAANDLAIRLVQSQGRAGGVSGAVGSQISQVLASLALRKNRVSETSAYPRGDSDLRGRLDFVLKSLPKAPVIKAGSIVYDPACGIGEVLQEVASAQPGAQIFGSDINVSALSFAERRALLNGLNAKDYPAIFFAIRDVLHDSTRVADDQGADAVVSEPPFGLRTPRPLSGSDIRWRFGVPRGNATDFAWPQDAIYQLKPDGRAYVLTSGSNLFTLGLANTIRRKLVAERCVEAIVALPAGILTYTSIPVYAWVLRNPQNSTDQIKEVVFVDATESQATSVPIEEILSSDEVNLLPQHWLKDLSATDRNLSDEVASNLSAVAERTKAIGAAKLPNVPRMSFPGDRTLTVGELHKAGPISEVWRGDFQKAPNEEAPVWVIQPNALSTNTVSQLPAAPRDTRERLTEPGDVIVNTVGKVRAEVDESGGHQPSRVLWVIRTNPRELDPHFLASALTGAWNQKSNKGYSVAGAPLRSLEIPILPRETQAEIAETLKELTHTEKAAQALAESANQARNTLLEAARYGADLTTLGTNPTLQKKKGIS